MAKKTDNSPPPLLIKLQYFPSLKALTHEEAGRLFMALMEYATTGGNTQPLKNEALLFPMMQADRDSDVAAWEKKADTSRDNGKKGGRPRKNQQTEDEDDTKDEDENPENPAGFSETQKTPYTFTPSSPSPLPFPIPTSVESDRSAAVGNYLSDYDDLTATTNYARKHILGFTEYNAQEIVRLMTRGNTMTGGLICYAIDAARSAGKTDGWGYTHNILERYQKQGFKTVKDAQTDSKEFGKAKQKAVQGY